MVTMDEINGPDLINKAFQEKGLTAEEWVDDLLTERSLYRNALNRKKRATHRNLQILKEFGKFNERLSAYRGWKKPERHEHSGAVLMTVSLSHDDREMIKEFLDSFKSRVIEESI